MLQKYVLPQSLMRTLPAESDRNKEAGLTLKADKIVRYTLFSAGLERLARAGEHQETNPINGMYF